MDEVYRVTTNVRRSKTSGHPAGYVRHGSRHMAECAYNANKATGVKVERITGTFTDVTSEFSGDVTPTGTGWPETQPGRQKCPDCCNGRVTDNPEKTCEKCKGLGLS